MGHHAASLIAQRLQADLRLGAVLHQERRAFHQTVASGLQAAARRAMTLLPGVAVGFAAFRPLLDVVSLIRAFRARADAVAACAVTHPDLTLAVQEPRDARVPCFSRLNDFAPGMRRNCLGLSNPKVGRVAASVIALAAHRPGKLAVFVGGSRWHGHEPREMGFGNHVRECRPEHLLTALPRAMRVLADPAECGPVTLAFCQDVQAESWYPADFFEPRAWRRRRAEPDPVVMCAAGIRLGEFPKLWKESWPMSCHMEYDFSCMSYEGAGAMSIKMAEHERDVARFVAHAGARGAIAVKAGRVAGLGAARARRHEARGRCVIVNETETDPLALQGGQWWHVAVPEVSGRQEVRASRARYEEMVGERR